MSSRPSLQMGRREWALLLLLSILWGGSFFFAKIAVAEIAPLTLVCGRVGIAALALLLGLRVFGIAMPRGWRLWLSFAVMGALNNVVPFGLLFWGQSHITSGLASILNAFTPIFTVIVAHYATTDEKLTSLRLAGVATGIVGVVVTIGPDALTGLDANVAAAVACLAATLSYALAGVYGRRFKALPSTAVAAGQLTASTILCLPLALLLERPWQHATPGVTALAALAGIAIVSTAAAYVIYFRILARSGASNLLLVTFLIPVCALLLGTSILGEELHAHQLAGMLAIGFALILIDGRLLRAARKEVVR